MLHWLLTTYGHEKSNPEAKNFSYRLQRIHFSSLTYHISVGFIKKKIITQKKVNKGTDWSNLAAGLAAGARIAGRQACHMAKDRTDFDLVEIRTSNTVMLDRKVEKIYQFNPHR